MVLTQPRARPPFKNAPTIVSSCLDEIDFFNGILSDIADVEFLCCRIEREPPGISEAVRVNLVPPGFTSVEWIGFRRGVWNACAGGVIDVDPQYLPEQSIQILSIV